MATITKEEIILFTISMTPEELVVLMNCLYHGYVVESMEQFDIRHQLHKKFLHATKEEDHKYKGLPE
jgi:hypothetical protein